MQLFKTIKLGTHSSSKALYNELIAKGFNVGEYAKQLLDKTPICAPQEIELVKVTVKELGFDKYAAFEEICDAAKEKGFGLCPAEVGPQLLLQYIGQPIGDWLRVGMKPIADSDGDPLVWRVSHDDGDRWLSTVYVHPTSEWDPEAVWAFSSVPSKHLELDNSTFALRLLALETTVKKLTDVIKV